MSNVVIEALCLGLELGREQTPLAFGNPWGLMDTSIMTGGR
jgi:hypothetical protein